jgi:hypothetical protein
MWLPQEFLMGVLLAFMVFVLCQRFLIVCSRGEKPFILLETQNM